MDAIPLGPEDRAILALENDVVAGHTCKVIRLGGDELDVAALRDAIGARLIDAPALTRRLGGTQDAPAWVPDPDFDVADHVTQLLACTTTALPATVAGRFSERLDRSRPLWHVDVIPIEDGGSVLVWRIHHALADGTVAMRLANAILWDAREVAGGTAGARTRGAATASAHGTAAPSGAASRAAAASDAAEERRRAHLAAFLRREAPRPGARSPFAGRIGPRRAVAFARVPFRDLHDAAKRLEGATVNDAVLALVAGALRRWGEHRHGRLGTVRVRVPVSLHGEADDTANRDSFFTVPLPLHEPDPVERLRAVHHTSKACKEAGDAERIDALEHASPRLGKLLTHVESGPAAFALSVSNVPGPRSRVAVLGAPVEELHTLAEIGERHALRVAAISLAGEQLGFGFCADPEIVADLDLLADGVEAEAADLVRAAA